MCSISACVQNLPTAFAVVWRLVCTSCRPSLTSYGVSYFLIPHSLWPTLLIGVGLCLIVGFSSFSLFFCSFLQSCYHFLLYHSSIPAVALFDPSLLGLFGPATYSSLNDTMWSFGLCITLLVGSFVPFISSWASLAHLLSLALFLTLHSHGLLLTPLGFPSPITLSFILRAHGLLLTP